MSIFRPRPVNEEPIVSLWAWRVYLVKGNGTFKQDTIHFVGHTTGRVGRVSSPVVSFNQATRLGTTQSGRTYDLSGDDGYSAVADDVFKAWLAMAGNPDIENITDKYRLGK